MRSKTAACFFCASAFVNVACLVAGSPAQALIVTINGSDYDVLRQRINYNDNRTLMESQPWWGDENLAITFANTVGYGLGRISAYGETSGPIFAYTINSSVYPVAGHAFGFPYGPRTQSGLGETLDFAVATAIPAPASAAVPAPLPILASFAAYGWSRRLRAKIHSASKQP